MDAPRLKEDVWRRVIHHVAANEYEERRTAGYSAQESMRKRDLLALLHVSSVRPLSTRSLRSDDSMVMSELLNGR